MNNFKISTRLIMLTGVLSFLLLALGVWGLIGISQSNAALKTVYEDRTVPVGQLSEVRATCCASACAWTRPCSIPRRRRSRVRWAR